jgi:serine/threonine-protein kinase
MLQHEDEHALIGTCLAGRYRIESLLGAGGTGTVYLATHLTLKRHLAIKVIHAELLADERAIARFTRAARAASRAVHPHIAAVELLGRTDRGLPYLVMEYVEGPTLAELLDREPRGLALPRALAILHQIATALEAAHQQQVMHRDLKPANVVLTTHDGRGDFVKILDFGIAKFLGDDGGGPALTQQGETHGTPEYMSPEQCMGDRLDHRTDIYSFGVLAYEVVVGTVPFDFGGRMHKVWEAHLSLPPPVPSEAAGRPEVPPELDELILRCLAKRPGERFAETSALVAGLARLRESSGS